jgi:hypothetical protein
MVIGWNFVSSPLFLGFRFWFLVWPVAQAQNRQLWRRRGAARVRVGWVAIARLVTQSRKNRRGAHPSCDYFGVAGLWGFVIGVVKIE